MTNQDSASILTALSTVGFALVPPLQPEQFAELRDWLLARPVFVDAHVPQTARNRGEDIRWNRHDLIASVSECVCVHTDDAILAPHVLEKGLEYLDVASTYLGRDPAVCYSANFFWTRPGPAAERPDIQGFHRDADDTKFLGLFFYLTDVFDDADGPHDLTGPDGVTRTIYGPAGTMFIADTSNEHRGRKPTKAERGFGWWRYGVSDRPPANEWDKIEPIPASAFDPLRIPFEARHWDAIRLLVKP